MRQLPINLTDLEDAMSFRWSESDEGAVFNCLDLQTGRLVMVWDDDDAFAATMNQDPGVNARLREAVESDPERYIDVPEFDQHDDNVMLREFLDSPWTEDAELRRRAAGAYAGSVSRWKKSVADEAGVIDAWNRFQNQARRRRALEFLAEHGIEPLEAGEDR